jgi:sugar phosphate isomerase/epimerase
MKGIELFNNTARTFIKDGIFLSYHNHAQEFRKFDNHKRGMDLLFENLDPGSVRFLLDTHWLQSGGADIIEWMEKCKGRMKHLHVKDYRLAPANYKTSIGGVDKQFSQIGDGQLPWELIIQKGLELGIETFIAEQDKSYDEDPFDCSAQSFAKLKSLGLR